MNRDHLVRPRWVWSGLILAILGACMLAFWFATWQPSTCVAGAVLLLLGSGVAVRGGILYDTHGARPVTGEVDEVRHADVHRGTAPGDMVTDARLQAEARAWSRQTDELLRASREAQRPAWDRLGAILLLSGAGFLLAAQGLYPHTQTGQNNATRSLLLGVVIALTGLRVLLASRPGRAAPGVAALAGLGLILGAVLADHDRPATVAVEIIVGAVVLVGATLSLDHPEPPQRTGGARRDGAASEGSPAAETGPEVSVGVLAVVAGAVFVAGTAGIQLVRTIRGRISPSGGSRHRS